MQTLCLLRSKDNTVIELTCNSFIWTLEQPFTVAYRGMELRVSVISAASAGF